MAKDDNINIIRGPDTRRGVRDLQQRQRESARLEAEELSAKGDRERKNTDALGRMADNSEEGNKLFEEANSLANKANELAEKAFKLAEEAQTGVQQEQSDRETAVKEEKDARIKAIRIVSEAKVSLSKAEENAIIMKAKPAMWKLWLGIAGGVLAILHMILRLAGAL